MKLNNKGVSLIEIIISITLISMVVVFLLSTLITVRYEDRNSKRISQLILNQALITKEIHTDFIERQLVGIETCEDGGTNRSNDSVRNFIKTSNNTVQRSGQSNCLKLIYDQNKGDDNIGYLVYYSYDHSTNNNALNSVGYKRGNKSVFRETHVKPSETGTAEVNCVADICTVNIHLPILAENGDDYGINLSYIADTSVIPFNVEKRNSSYYKFNIS